MISNSGVQSAEPEVDRERNVGDPGHAVLAPGVPLCVDLDGTLVKSDTLVDSVLVLARQNPAGILRIPSWIAQGKAKFKKSVTSAVTLDVEHLPYNRPLLEWLRAEHGTGRAIYLATAADRTLAERVAGHLGIFTGVLASDGQTNLAGKNKLRAFRDQFGERFCYIGNAKPDVSLLCACESPMMANPHGALSAGLRKAGKTPAATFEDRTPAVKSWLRAVRLHQWAKNTLIFVPLLLSHAWSMSTVAGGVVAFLSFGLCASATYIINDLLDLEVDRRHPRKRRRPFAAGDLSAIAGVSAVVLMMVAAFVLALMVPRVILALPGRHGVLLPHSFLKWLVLYTVTTLTYSMYVKRLLLLDVFVLSGLYTVRILAGSAATTVPISEWLGAFSVFFFLSLAFVKRFSELESLRERGGAAVAGRGYHISDVEQLRAFGTGSMFAAVLVTTLYISNPQTSLLYAHALRLWLVIPVLLLWLSEVWMLASRGQMHDDPVVWAITSKRSLLLGAVMAAIVWSAL